MNHVYTVSRRARAGLIASAAVLAAVLIVTQHIRPVRWANDPELTALATERDRLRASDDRTRDALRERHRTLMRDAWTTEKLTDLQRQIGSDWHWKPEPAAPNALHRRFRLTALPRKINHWSAVVATVETLEKHPGVVLESLDITASGSGSQRRFTRCAVVVRFIWKNSPSPGNTERGAALFPRSLFRGGETGTVEEVRASRFLRSARRPSPPPRSPGGFDFRLGCAPAPCRTHLLERGPGLVAPFVALNAPPKIARYRQPRKRGDRHFVASSLPVSGRRGPARPRKFAPSVLRSARKLASAPAPAARTSAVPAGYDFHLNKNHKPSCSRSTSRCPRPCFRNFPRRPIN